MNFAANSSSSSSSGSNYFSNNSNNQRNAGSSDDDDSEDGLPPPPPPPSLKKSLAVILRKRPCLQCGSTNTHGSTKVVFREEKGEEHYMEMWQCSDCGAKFSLDTGSKLQNSQFDETGEQIEEAANAAGGRALQGGGGGGGGGLARGLEYTQWAHRPPLSRGGEPTRAREAAQQAPLARAGLGC